MMYYFRLTEGFIPNSQTARQYLKIIKKNSPNFTSCNIKNIVHKQKIQYDIIVQIFLTWTVLRRALLLK